MRFDFVDQPLKRVGKNGQVSVGNDLRGRIVQVERGDEGVFLRFIDMERKQRAERTREPPMEYNTWLLLYFRDATVYDKNEYIGPHGLRQDVLRRKYEEYLARVQAPAEK